MVLLLAVLVVGLLRSHADILRALHRLGAGVGDPMAPEAGAGGAPVPVAAPVLMGPPLPGERNAATAPDVAGVTPAGDARSIRVTGVGHHTLLAFLSSGCATCAGIWPALADPAAAGLPPDVRVVAVTKGPEFEVSADVASRAPHGLLVVMSTESWSDYEVPGSPFFVLVDGPGGRRVGEGVATRLPQVAELVRRATADGGAGRAAAPAATVSRAAAAGLDGPAREARNDAELAAAGILPDDPSLYPRSLEDLFEPGPGPRA